MPGAGSSVTINVPIDKGFDASIDYSVPAGILGKIDNQLLLEHMNQRNLDTMVHGLKIFCET